MEQFVLGIFQEHLSKFIVDFHKEQVNANLLNGKGEIKDVSLNCAFLNELLKKVTPFVELESVHVSKLSFHVTSWANLKKAPIVMDIEDVTATIVEPLGFLDRSQRKTARQISQQELNDLIQQGLHKLRGAYNLFDRIVDNIHVEMRSLVVSFQPRGKFKTCRIGVWTPPTVLVQLRHIKYVSVDEYGQEGTPEQVWNHNRHAHGIAAPQRTIMIYKKLSLQCTMGLKDAMSGEELPSLIRDASIEVHVAFRKRLRDAAVLAVQVDVTARKVEVHIPTEVVPMMSHALAGIQYCLAKDRAFQDPLVAKTDASTEETKQEATGSTTISEESAIAAVTTEQEQSLEEESDNDHSDDEMLAADVSVSDSSDDEDEDDGADDKEDSTKPDSPARQASSVSARSQSFYQRRPVIMLPNGLVIHERLSLSLSVHQCTVRGIYSEKDDGYVQLVTKGLVAEAMWPKDSGDKGAYVQASLSFISLQEKYGQRIRSILLGGVQHNASKLPIGLPGKPRPEKGADSSFPLFEDRSIRPDPFGLRHTFPEQAFGMKMTIDFIEKVSNPEEEDIMVLHEIGIDQFDVHLDTDAWCRVLRFAMNENGNGFDDRWHSGDWGDELETDMLVNPTEALNLVDHLQPQKELFLDENFMISSDLMNVTARIVNVEIRVPAAIQKDVRSCDIILTVSEVMLVVSSALPRTFLTGKIGASIHGEGAESRGKIVFPNDPSDLCYSLEATEDPSIRQLGTMAAKGISTARCQLTIRGLSVRVVPVIPFCNASQPQQLLEPTEATCIVCFEGEPDPHESNLIKIVLFISLQFHRLAINCDLDIITGALSTIIYHSDVLQETAAVIEELRSSSPSATVALEQEDVPRMNKTLKNRRVLVKRQLAKSREAGGLSVSACMQLAEFSFTIWRQNVPLTSRFRASLSKDLGVRVDDTPIDLMKLMLFEANGVEVGAECLIEQTHSRRIVVKGCLSELKMNICDFEVERAKCLDKKRNRSYGAGDDGTANEVHDAHSLIEILTFGLHAHEHRSYAEVAWGHNDILLRMEDHLNSTRSMSLACEVGPPGVIYLRVREIESLCLLLIEALLMPTGLQADRFKTDGRHSTGIVFPDRSVGALLSWFIRNAGGRGDADSEVVVASEGDTSNTEIEVDDLVHASVLTLLPERTNQVMAQLMVVDVLVFVPDTAVRPETEDETRWLGLVVHQTRLLSGYFSPESSNEQHAIMNTLASRGIEWSSLFASQESGIHLFVRARPSLYNGIRKDSICVTTECLVSEFEISCSYHPSDFALSMGDTTLSVKNLDDLSHLHCSMLAVKDQGTLSAEKLGAVVTALRHEERLEVKKHSAKKDGAVIVSTEHPEVLGPSSKTEPASETEQSLHGLRRSLDRLREISEAHALQLKDVLERQQQQIGCLRYEVFSRERDRIAALALVSSQASGWLKMGGTHVYGQRLSGVTTMWRYYAVLRKSLLILYSSPGQSKPMDIIFLEGAHLLPLAGGRRKRDVKRGFSIIESGGVVRFFLAETGPEFESWIRDIDRITQSSRDNESTELFREDSVDSEQGRELPGSLSRDHSGDSFDPETSQRRAQIRERFSAVTSSTKNKLGSAAAGAKTRLGPAASSTKNRIGSAVQAARHRSLSNTDDGVVHDAQEQMPQPRTPERVSMASSTSQADSVSSGDHGMVEPGTNQPRRAGGRLAAVKAGTKNRFGSALQAAKEKGKAAAEQRRRRIQERGDHAAFQSHDAETDSFTAGVEAQSIMAENPTELRSTVVPLDEQPVAAPHTGHEGQGITFDSPEKPEWAAGGDDEPDIIQTANPMTPPGPARGQQLKSKLGAAVQSVRGSAAPDSSLRRRFGSSGREETDDARFFDPSSAVKLRGIHVGRGNPVDELNDKHLADVDVELKTIKGHWIASVEMCSVETDVAAPLEEGNTVNETRPTSTTSELSQEESGDLKAETPPWTELGTEAENDVHKAATLSDRQKRLENAYKICIRQGKDGADMKEVVRSLSDLLSLQTALSECVSRVILVASVGTSRSESEADKEVKPDPLSEHDMNSLDSVRLAGRLLRGLVETGSDEFEHAKEFHEYQCELLKEFLNLTLDAPLPSDAIDAMSRFLECSDMVSGSSIHQKALTSHNDLESLDVVGPAIEPPIASSQEILACTVACENDLIRLETQSDFTHVPVVEMRKEDQSTSRDPARDFSPAPVVVTPAPFLGALLPFEIVESLQGAMHGALMRIMTERDESHAQLIAASVLHVHEIEHERKRVDRLTQQLEACQARLKVAQAQNVTGNFFADKRLPEPNRESAKRSAVQEQVMQNSEQEMLNLCQQLASEISAKTSASLEIIRLKESRKLEQESEQAEKTALQDELKRCKELLALQERKTEEATQAADTWRKAYDQAKEKDGDGSTK